jgi:hypothetical protein
MGQKLSSYKASYTNLKKFHLTVLLSCMPMENVDEVKS